MLHYSMRRSILARGSSTTVTLLHIQSMVLTWMRSIHLEGQLLLSPSTLGCSEAEDPPMALACASVQTEPLLVSLLLPNRPKPAFTSFSRTPAFCISLQYNTYRSWILQHGQAKLIAPGPSSLAETSSLLGSCREPLLSVCKEPCLHPFGLRRGLGTKLLQLRQRHQDLTSCHLGGGGGGGGGGTPPPIRVL